MEPDLGGLVLSGAFVIIATLERGQPDRRSRWARGRVRRPFASECSPSLATGSSATSRSITCTPRSTSASSPSALVGACLGFLWWNAAPARIIMGDTGSLAMGTGLGALCLLMNLDLLLPIIGGLFVAETMSVILQVVSFRLFGRRIFRMAPFHHHFELRGWPETTVIIRFWILAGLLAMLGLGIFYGDFLKIAKVV